jgi:glycosyltransferase involved in cell wall biosynthesis
VLEDARPEIAVAVPSHERPLRLRWLLEALAGQTLPRGRFEIVVCHDSAGPETAELLASHPLAADGTLRAVALPAGSGPPAVQRNRAWRAARAPLVAFTDDDCRPAPDWLAQLLGAAGRHPGAIVQGRTAPDPDEAWLLAAAARARSMDVTPPTRWGETSNIAYPRALLERLGGFEERIGRASGEDADLALRAQEQGAECVAVPEAVCWHAVECATLRGALARAWRWQDLPAIVARHPQARSALYGRLFWRSAHAWLPLALAGLVLAARGRPAGAVLALPYARAAWPARGSSVRGRLRAASELPERALIDAVEMAGLARGSVRWRSVLL